MKTRKDKEQIISAISDLGDLSKLLENLLVNAGFLSNIERNKNLSIFALQKGVDVTKYCYIPTIDPLLGQNPRIFDIIDELNQDSNIDKFCIVTSKPANYHHDISDYFKKQIGKRFPTANVIFWTKDELIDNIDKFYPVFWQNTDTYLKPYEDYYIKSIETDSELRNLLKLDDKYKKMLNIFIEPTLTISIEDQEGHRYRRKRIEKSKLIAEGCYLIAGDAGTGKTTLLKEIGRELIDNNSRIGANGKKRLPIFIKHTDFLNNKFSLKGTIESVLLRTFQSFDLEKLYEECEITLLIDSLDELERKHQVSILNELNQLCGEPNKRFILATRSYEALLKDCKIKPPQHITIQNFNLKQIEAFLQTFFKFDELKANTLLQSLRANRILDKLPITPLTLSVISILYEERQYEIPATITDVYNNFSQFLLGRTSVKSNLEFLDITIKERILSIYALDILQNDEKKPKNVEEFLDFTKNFLTNRQKSVDNTELLASLTQGTGILFIDENNAVNFKHNFFMEYYASVEIFKHQRKLETKLIDKFTDFNWQNTAIFYAGTTKDMPEFLDNLIKKMKTYEGLVDCLVAVSGMGYLLQALYMTRTDIRKEGIKQALATSLRSLDSMKLLASNKATFFSDVKYPTLVLASTLFFYKDFTSITLRDPLVLAFDELFKDYRLMKANKDIHKTNALYQLFCVALCLKSDRINQEKQFEALFDEKDILNDPIMLMLFGKITDITEGVSKAKHIKKEKEFDKYVRKHTGAFHHYITTPTDQLRLTSFDNIGVIKNVEIYTEGKTDPPIIERAHAVLTNNSTPYWTIRSCGNDALGGGAKALKMFLESIEASLKNNPLKVVIGLFDNDSEGQSQFEGLKNKPTFEKWKCSKRIIKHKEYNLFALKLPISSDKNHYLNEKQNLNFFEIEHYFPNDYLEEQGMIEPISGMTDIFEIKGKNKQKFATIVTSETDRKLFENFKVLFDEIDQITGQRTEYTEEE